MLRRTNEGKKILSARWTEYNKQIHYRNLRNIKGQVDSSCPITYGSLRRKPKKEQLLEDRFTEIERENRILLEKMSHIVNSRHQRSSSSNQKKSLNVQARKRQNMQIVLENQALLKRLQDKQPSYSVYKWEEERKSTEKRLQNICEYPYSLGNYDESPRKIGEIHTRQNSRSRKIIRISDSMLKKTGKQSPSNKTKTQTVFKKGMSVGNKHFIIEIQKRQEKIVILAFDIESPESFSLELSHTEAFELMGGKENYKVLAKMLGIEDGELILVDSEHGDNHLNDVEKNYGYSKNPHEDDIFVESQSLYHRKNNSYSTGVGKLDDEYKSDQLKYRKKENDEKLYGKKNVGHGGDGVKDKDKDEEFMIRRRSSEDCESRSFKDEVDKIVNKSKDKDFEKYEENEDYEDFEEFEDDRGKKSEQDLDKDAIEKMGEMRLGGLSGDDEEYFLEKKNDDDKDGYGIEKELDKARNEDIFGFGGKEGLKEKVKSPPSEKIKHESSENVIEKHSSRFLHEEIENPMQGSLENLEKHSRKSIKSVNTPSENKNPELYYKPSSKENLPLIPKEDKNEKINNFPIEKPLSNHPSSESLTKNLHPETSSKKSIKSQNLDIKTENPHPAIIDHQESLPLISISDNNTTEGLFNSEINATFDLHLSFLPNLERAKTLQNSHKRPSMLDFQEEDNDEISEAKEEEEKGDEGFDVFEDKNFDDHEESASFEVNAHVEIVYMNNEMYENYEKRDLKAEVVVEIIEKRGFKEENEDFEGGGGLEKADEEDEDKKHAENEEDNKGLYKQSEEKIQESYGKASSEVDNKKNSLEKAGEISEDIEKNLKKDPQSIENLEPQ